MIYLFVLSIFNFLHRYWFIRRYLLGLGFYSFSIFYDLIKVAFQEKNLVQILSSSKL